MRESLLKPKSFAFAIRIFKLCTSLKKEYQELVVLKQLLRSGTAIGALIREAEFAESLNDFIHKLAIGIKEANETIYWLELLQAIDFLNSHQFESINNDATE